MHPLPRSLRGPLAAGWAALLPAALAAACLAGSPAPGRPAVGQMAPDFRLEALGRKGAAPTTLKGLSGQVVLVDFWATWCAPCKQTLPELARLRARHPGLKVLAVNLDEDRARAEGFLKGYDTGLAALHDAKREVAARYDLGGMPSAVLIDRQGVLRARYDGYTEHDLKRMEAEARELLEEKP